MVLYLYRTQEMRCRQCTFISARICCLCVLFVCLVCPVWLHYSCTKSPNISFKVNISIHWTPLRYDSHYRNRSVISDNVVDRSGFMYFDADTLPAWANTCGQLATIGLFLLVLSEGLGLIFMRCCSRWHKYHLGVIGAQAIFTVLSGILTMVVLIKAWTRYGDLTYRQLAGQVVRHGTMFITLLPIMGIFLISTMHVVDFFSSMREKTYHLCGVKVQDSSAERERRPLIQNKARDEGPNVI